MRLCLSALAVGLLCSASAQAQTTIFSNFGPSDSFSNSSAWSIGGDTSGVGFLGIGRADIAARFTTDANGWSGLSFEGALQNVNGVNGLILRLHGDLGGLPDEGNVLAVSAPFTVGGSTTNVLTWTLDPLVTLAPSTTYWVSTMAVDTTGLFQWWLNTTGDNGSARRSGTPVGGWGVQGFAAPTFRISGDALSTAAPEPSTAALALVGLAAGGRLARRRRHAA